MSTQPAFTTQTLTSTMSPIEDLSQYPPYCQKGGPDTKSHPIIRARKLFAEGIKMPLDKRCTNCIMLGQDCIRCDTKFSKCCWCTAEDMHPTGMCHLPGAPEPSNLSMTALAKKRKLERKVESQSSSSAGYGQSQFEGRPRKMVKRSPEYQVSELENVTDSNPVRIAPRSQAPSPESAASQSGSIQVPATLRDVHQCDCDATSERMTALENTCSDLNDKFTALQGKVEELKSIVKPDLNTSVITADVPTADVHEDDVITSADVKDEPEMMAIGESIIIDTPSPVMTVSVESWGNGDNVPEHTISHPADSPPTDCICMQREELRAQLSTPLEQDPAAEIAHDLQTDVF